jgi:glycosyltransferase involved in cell wall biosynthesis
MSPAGWRGRAGRVLRRASVTDLPGSDPLPEPAKRILASGIFDLEYYEIQCGTGFASPEDAVRDFLQHGHRLGRSPHPLFEPEWFRRERPRNRPNTLLEYLRTGGGEHGPGPLFDEAAYLAEHPEAGGHVGRPLGHFLAHSHDNDPLPVPRERRTSRLTWGEARDLAYASAREFRRFEDLRSAPRRGPWDEGANRRFVADWLGRAPRRLDRPRPTVSVVMPVRNRPVQVLEAIESVREQTMPDWELIVVDDGSTDDTADVVARAASADPRIRLVRRPASGVCAARNAGIDAAVGEWLAFLDSDNTWVPHFLGVMSAYLEAKALRAGHAVIDTLSDPDDESSGRYLAFDGGLEHLLVRNHIDLNGLMVQTQVAREVGAFDESLRRWVDHDFAIRVAEVTPIPLVPFVGVRYDHQLGSVDRITTTESDYWEWVVLAKHHVDWNAVKESVADRRADLVSVCMPSVEDWAHTQVALDAVLDAADAAAEVDLGAASVEVVLLINGSRRCVGTILRSLYGGDSRVRILSVPRNLNFSVSSNHAFSASRGQTVVFLDNDTEVLHGWLAPLVEALEDPEVLGTQALLLNPDGSIQSAGWAFTGAAALPSALLANHPVEDAVAAAPIRLRAVAASALAMRAHDVVALGGFDPAYVNGCEDIDLCLRAAGSTTRRFAVAVDSRVVHHRRRPLPRYYDRGQENRRTWMARWAGIEHPSDLGIVEDLGFRVAHLNPGEAVAGPRDVRIPEPVVVRPGRLVASGPAAGEPCLRWALQTSVPLRDTTGSELDLAEALGNALRLLGQDVVIDRLEANQRQSSYLDDVAVALLRDTALMNQPGLVNIAWVLGGAAPFDDDTARRYDALLTLTTAGAALHDAGSWRASVELDGLHRPDDQQLEVAARLLLTRAIELRAARAQSR